MQITIFYSNIANNLKPQKQFFLIFIQLMNTILNTYPKKIFFLSTLLIIFCAMLEGAFGSKVISVYSYILVVFFTTLSYFTHFLVLKGFSKTPLDAQNYFMLSTTLKIVLSAIILFSYFYFIKKEATSFLFNFFIVYFIYSFFEIKTLLLSLHPNSKGDTKENEKKN